MSGGAPMENFAGVSSAEKSGKRRNLDWTALLAVAFGVFYACVTLALREDAPVSAYPVGVAKGGGAALSAPWAQAVASGLDAQSQEWLRAHPTLSAQCASAGWRSGWRKDKTKPAWTLWEGARPYPWVGAAGCPASPSGMPARWRLGWDAKAGQPVLWGDAKLAAWSGSDSQERWAKALGAALAPGFASLREQEQERQAREGWQLRFAQKSALSAEKRLEIDARESADPALAGVASARALPQAPRAAFGAADDAVGSGADALPPASGASDDQDAAPPPTASMPAPSAPAGSAAPGTAKADGASEPR
jgi:hypothetical protein